MITFREIDKSNYMDCICLQVADGQKGFVADNARSLVEARFEEGLYTRGIYADGVMVGFLLFDYDPEIPGWSLSRMMIGAQYQGRGYGTAAVKAFLQYIRDTMAIRELYLCVELETLWLPPCITSWGSVMWERWNTTLTVSITQKPE